MTTRARRGEGAGPVTGLTIERHFTTAGQDPFATVEWTKRTSRITNPDGSVVFEMKDAEIPATWSQVATDIMVSKYFRKAGVPQFGDDGQPLVDEAGEPVLGPERSARQVIASPADGPGGATTTATSRRRPTPTPSMTSWPTCWCTRWRPPIRRSGSIPA